MISKVKSDSHCMFMSRLPTIGMVFISFCIQAGELRASKGVDTTVSSETSYEVDEKDDFAVRVSSCDSPSTHCKFIEKYEAGQIKSNRIAIDINGVLFSYNEESTNGRFVNGFLPGGSAGYRAPCDEDLARKTDREILESWGLRIKS